MKAWGRYICNLYKGCDVIPPGRSVKHCTLMKLIILGKILPTFLIPCNRATAILNSAIKNFQILMSCLNFAL